MRKSWLALCKVLGGPAQTFHVRCVFGCEQIDATFAQIKHEYFGTVHTVVHAVAFAPADAIHRATLSRHVAGGRSALRTM